MFIDTHTHLSDPKLGNIHEVVMAARAAGVERMIVPTTSIVDLEEALSIANKYDDVYLLAGVHPEEIDTVDSIPKMIVELKENIVSSKKILGVGEIGLDFYWDKEKKTKEGQVEIFRAQMEMAASEHLPVAIHMRDAISEMYEVLSQLPVIPEGQFHCFAGDEKFLKHVLDLGFYVSFAGNITYKSAGLLRDLVKIVPPDRLLLETDSPYLPPEPLRGRNNEPANVKIIAEFIANELNVDLEKLAEITTKNAKYVYAS